MTAWKPLPPLPGYNEFEEFEEFGRVGTTKKLSTFGPDKPKDWCTRCDLGVDYKIDWRDLCPRCGYPGLKDKINLTSLKEDEERYLKSRLLKK